MSKRDGAIVGIILLLALLIWGVNQLTQSSRQSTALLWVDVTVSGEAYLHIPLGEPHEFLIEQTDKRRNVLEIDSEGVLMAESSCPDQLCVHQGKVTAGNIDNRPLGALIICLPNQVVVELTADEGVGAP